jgi:Glycerol uptake facilitator and related permeases (Major Intrinsic Protein Family)
VQPSGLDEANLAGIQNSHASHKSPGSLSSPENSQLPCCARVTFSLHAVFCRRTLRHFYHARDPALRNELMSMNPARTFGLAFLGRYWHALWAYFLAPILGMLVAAELFLWVRGGSGPYCAKLHHANDKRCIFRHGPQQVDPT